MMSTARRFGATMSALILGAFGGDGLLSSYADIAPRPRVHSGRSGNRYPFSSDRQHQRAANLHMVVMRNGHEVMQQRRRAA